MPESDQLQIRFRRQCGSRKGCTLYETFGAAADQALFSVEWEQRVFAQLYSEAAGDLTAQELRRQLPAKLPGLHHCLLADD